MQELTIVPILQIFDTVMDQLHASIVLYYATTHIIKGTHQTSVTLHESPQSLAGR